MSETAVCPENMINLFIIKIEEEQPKKDFIVLQKKDKTECIVCNKKFLKSSNCERHERNVHHILHPKNPKMKINPSKYGCSVCSKCFASKSNLKRHENDAHDIKPPQKQQEKLFQCKWCVKKFTYLSNLSKHKKNSHKNEVQVKVRNRLKCSICFQCFPTKSAFDGHFITDHPDIHLKTDILTFKTNTGFENWKLQMEENTASLYTKGNHIQGASSSVIQYYNCHRSGHYIPKGEGRRNLKAQGSNKIGFYCPSRIRTQTFKESDEVRIEVSFHSTHVGHECEPSRINFLEDTHAVDATKQAAGPVCNAKCKSEIIRTIKKTKETGPSESCGSENTLEIVKTKRKKRIEMSFCNESENVETVMAQTGDVVNITTLDEDSQLPSTTHINDKREINHNHLLKTGNSYQTRISGNSEGENLSESAFPPENVAGSENIINVVTFDEDGQLQIIVDVGNAKKNYVNSATKTVTDSSEVAVLREEACSVLLKLSSKVDKLTSEQCKVVIQTISELEHQLGTREMLNSLPSALSHVTCFPKERKK